MSNLNSVSKKDKTGGKDSNVNVTALVIAQGISSTSTSNIGAGRRNRGAKKSKISTTGMQLGQNGD